MIVSFGLAKVFGEVNKDILRAILYGKDYLKILSLPRLIKGREDNYLVGEIAWKISKGSSNNTGVFQGSPLCAWRFIIYMNRGM